MKKQEKTLDETKELAEKNQATLVETKRLADGMWESLSLMTKAVHDVKDEVEEVKKRIEEAKE